MQTRKRLRQPIKLDSEFECSFPRSGIVKRPREKKSYCKFSCDREGPLHEPDCSQTLKLLILLI